MKKRIREDPLNNKHRYDEKTILLIKKYLIYNLKELQEIFLELQIKEELCREEMRDPLLNDKSDNKTMGTFLRTITKLATEIFAIEQIFQYKFKLPKYQPF